MTRSDELRAEAAALEAQAAQLETPLSAEQVHELYRLRRYDEIAQAVEDGRLANLLDPTTPTEGA